MLYFKEDAQFWLFWACFIYTVRVGMASSTDCLNENVELLNFLNILFYFDGKNCNVLKSKNTTVQSKVRT